MYVIVTTTYSYKNLTPADSFESEIHYETKQDAELGMLYDIVEALNFFNNPYDSEYHYISRKRFFSASFEFEGCDGTILCWDGEDYDIVTSYKIEERS